MKKTLVYLITITSKLIAPLALALAVMSSNATCFFFTYQPDVPKDIEKYRASHRNTIKQ